MLIQCSVCDLNPEIIEKFQANKTVRLFVFHPGKVCTIRPWKFPEIDTGILNQIKWRAPLEFVNFGKCSSIRQFAEIQTRIFHRMESAVDNFSLHGACFLNCFFSLPFSDFHQHIRNRLSEFTLLFPCRWFLGSCHLWHLLLGRPYMHMYIKCSYMKTGFDTFCALTFILFLKYLWA